MGLGGFDSFGYLRYLLLNEIDRLEGNLSYCMIGKVGLERSLRRREFPRLSFAEFPLFLL